MAKCPIIQYSEKQHANAAISQECINPIVEYKVVDPYKETNSQMLTGYKDPPDFDKPVDIAKLIKGMISTSYEAPLCGSLTVQATDSVQTVAQQFYPMNNSAALDMTFKLMPNFDVLIKGKIMHHKDMCGDGDADITYAIEIYVEHTSLYARETLIYYTEASRQDIINISKYPGWTDDKAIYDSSQNTSRMFRNWISTKIAAIDDTTVHVFPKTGIVTLEGEHLFVTRNPESVCVKGSMMKIRADDNSYSCESLRTAERFDTLLGKIKISKDMAFGQILLMTLMLGCVEPILTDAGYPPKFMLVIIGETGSRKTSATIEFASVYNRSDNGTAAVECSFEMNKASIEDRICNGNNPLILIDDIRPLNSSEQRNRQQDKIEGIVRLYGDRKKKKGAKYAKGIGIMTGELIEGPESTIARMIQLKVNRDSIDNRALTELQNDNQIIPSFVIAFMKYLCLNYEKLVSLAHEVIPQKRIDFSGVFGGNSRLCEYAAQYSFVLKYCLRPFMAGLCVSDVEKIITEYSEIILDLLQEQIKIQGETNPVDKAILALREDYCDRLDDYVTAQKNSGKMSEGILRAIYDNNIYIYCEEVAKIIDNFNTPLKKELCKIGVLHKFSEGNKTRYDTKPVFIEGQKRYYVFSLSVISK